MVKKVKKTRKLRGHVSHGHGRIGRHRKHPSGRGYAGGIHHHRILMFKHHPGHFGKKGIRVFRWHKNRGMCKSVNLDRLWPLLSESSRKKHLGKPSSGELPVIDVTMSGYDKVLGRGRLPNVPVIVKARFFSDTAQRRIRKTGGSCILVP